MQTTQQKLSTLNINFNLKKVKLSKGETIFSINVVYRTKLIKAIATKTKSSKLNEKI